MRSLSPEMLAYIPKTTQKSFTGQKTFTYKGYNSAKNHSWATEIAQVVPEE
jgi:hypothetical protein